MNGYTVTWAAPRLEIIEQPAPKSSRFRYECEGRSAGSIPGIHSTSVNRTYPTIRVVGYDGNQDIVIVVSCVTKDEPYFTHPHKLVGKNCKYGVCSIILDKTTKTATFYNLGIQCVRKKDIEASLKQRQEKQVDPFGKGFSHINNTNSIDLNCVRLCFQAIIKDHPLRRSIIIGTVVSDPIYDKKTTSDLEIIRLSHSSATVRGGLEIIILCEKISKEDITVRFYEEGDKAWSEFANIVMIHKQVSIVITTPMYKNLAITDKIRVFVQLYRPTDQLTSNSMEFYYFPDEMTSLDQIPTSELLDTSRPEDTVELDAQNQNVQQLGNDFNSMSISDD